MKAPRGGILWGRHPAYGGGWQKLANYSATEAQAREHAGWEVLRLERGTWPPCDCGAPCEVASFGLWAGDRARFECRPCKAAREARDCPACSGRGTSRDERGRVTDRKCATCGGSGLRVATVTP